MKKLIPCLILVLTGCVVVDNSTKRVLKDGSSESTHTRAMGWGDQRTALAAVKNGIGSNGTNAFNGTSASGLDSTTSASNAVPIIEAVISGAIQGAVKAAAKP